MLFAYPGWLMLLFILPLILLGGILTHRRRNKAWATLVAPHLRKQLVTQTSRTRHWASLVLGLLGAALIIVAIARPYVGHTTTNEQIRTRNILIAIDTSRSMLVKDGSPNRMATAQAAAIELLESFPNDRVGIIAFSGAPLLMVPLTIDHAAVHETISQLDTRIIPRGGSDLNAAVQLALKTFEKTGQKGNALILISDGENHSQETEKTAKAIRDSGVTVCAISVGTEAGGIIPDSKKRDGKFRDKQGHTVLSRMIPEALDTLSRAGHGTYVSASEASTKTIATTISGIKRQQQLGRKRSIPSERFYWFLIPAALCLTLSLLLRSQLFTKKTNTRTTNSPQKKSAIALILLSFLFTHHLQASTLSDAKKAYQSKDYSTAITLFKIARNRAKGEKRHAIEFAMGATAYRMNLWTTATTHFSKALLTNNQKLQENTHYNLGESLFRTGLTILDPKLATESDSRKIYNTLFATTHFKEAPKIPADKKQKAAILWQDAIDHYQAALQLNPNNPNASDNLKNTQRLLDQLLQEPPPKEKTDPEDQYNPETDPNYDPNQQEGDNSKSKGEGDDPDKTSGKKDKDGEKDSKDQNNQNDDASKNSSDQSDKSNTSKGDGENQPQKKQKKGESDEAYAARILKENSDAEVRPVQRQILQLRRPAKDW